jgi:NitT/TauT family transport system substrate-binding protein
MPLIGTSATRPSRRRPIRILLLLAVAIALGALPTSCNKTPSGPKTKLTVAYLGLTCEAPIFAAEDQGFYKEEGLEVELVRTDWDGLREGLGTGRFDANHTLIMYVLKPIENKIDIKITGGIHTGCLRVQTGVKSDIKSVKDLKGKRIGVPTHIGSPPYLFASRVLAANGVNPRAKNDGGDIDWIPFPPDVLGKAIEDGRIDAMATSDPIGTILLGKGIVKTLADQAVDAPYKDEYCCATVVSGKLARENPESAAKVTRAMLKGAKWVQENPTAAAKMAVEKKYIAASVEINAQALSKLKYVPGVSRCRQSVDDAAAEMKLAGLLKEDTDPVELAKRAWVDLNGVDDKWVASLTVEKVAGGGPQPILPPPQFVALFEANNDCSCCCRCCIDK